MKTLLTNWKGSVSCDGKEYDTVQSFISTQIDVNKPFSVILSPKEKERQIEGNKQRVAASENSSEVIITVKKYMTKKATPQFEFMANWNNDNPMPLRTMVGKKVRETKGMVYMELHGDILQEVTPVCMKCGKPLTNPVSQYFGIGPECGSHNYVNPFSSDEELKDAVAQYKKKLQNVKWSGWIIKSAIIEEVER